MYKVFLDIMLARFWKCADMNHCFWKASLSVFQHNSLVGALFSPALADIFTNVFLHQLLRDFRLRLLLETYIVTHHNKQVWEWEKLTKHFISQWAHSIMFSLKDYLQPVS